jgi:hypothetical protein
MSIGRRVEDALMLHKAGRFEGALLSVLVAAAATARKEYPDTNIKDRECFEKFLSNSATLSKVRVEFRGALQPIPHIFYKWLRCELVHEGSIPLDIEFVGEASDRLMSVRAGGTPHYVLQLGHGWMFEILRLVQASRENRNQFK